MAETIPELFEAAVAEAADREWLRYEDQGLPGLVDRSHRAPRCSHQIGCNAALSCKRSSREGRAEDRRSDYSGDSATEGGFDGSTTRGVPVEREHGPVAS